MPGFYLNRSQQALDLIREVGSPNLLLQYDIYHMQIMEGDLAPTIERHLGSIGHMQLADTPGRHEPGTGEINYPFLFGVIDRLGYAAGSAANTSPAATPSRGWAGSSRISEANKESVNEQGRIHRLGHHGYPDGRAPDRGRTGGLPAQPIGRAQDLVGAGGHACASSKEVAQKADIIITMVPDTPDVGAVLFGENGVAAGLAQGEVVVDMSSISPVETKEYAKKINALGCDYLDAPVSGGDVGAKTRRSRSWSAARKPRSTASGRCSS